MKYRKPSLWHYRLAQGICWIFAKLFFRRKVLRNEIKNAKGPFVVIANHQAAFDFVNLIGLTKRPMTFVISNSFYNSLPITKFLDKLGVIPKQQFQTALSDMKKAKAVVDAGQPLVIYPAGLMCEDGLSTPIPAATCKFLRWLGADVYAAKVSGTYFAMPKWGRGIRRGRTYIDVYQLMSAEELAATDLDTIYEKTMDALDFDAYRQQEQLMERYGKGCQIDGLEHVLYRCPHCGQEYTICVRDHSALFCNMCGYEQVSDDYGFLHNEKGIGPEIRYVSDWSREIFHSLLEQVETGSVTELSAQTQIQMIDFRTHKFVPVGEGTVTLSKDGFRVDGVMHGEPVVLDVPVSTIPTLPFSPGKYFEVQSGKNIYRCVLADGRLVMKFINLVKAFYLLSHPTQSPVRK